MDNQHRQIKGYRELGQKEIDLMNRIKEFGPQLLELVNDIDTHLTEQHRNAQGAREGNPANMAELNRLTTAKPYDWLETGTRQLQRGLMDITRAVAQPTFF